MHLNDYDTKYENLVESYVNIGQITQIADTINIFSKFPAIPETLHASISARFSIPLEQLVAGDKLFEEMTGSCKKAFEKLNALYEETKITINVFKKELDALDVEISRLNNPIGYLEWATKGYTPKKARLSPLDSTFSAATIK